MLPTKVEVAVFEVTLRESTSMPPTKVEVAVEVERREGMRRNE